MSGHSKWSTIKRKKGEKDNARAKVFTKISREILVCVKETGSADPATNGKLRDLVAKARANNIPGDNIDRLLKKAAGGTEKNDYEVCVYEGYGAGGIAVMAECLTDNRNRTAGEIRHYFDKYGGNMGATGCVSFMFAPKGVVVIDNDPDTAGKGDRIANDDDDFAEFALEAEAGASDYDFSDGIVELYCDPADVSELGARFRSEGYRVLSAEVQQLPDLYTTLTDDEQIKKVSLLLDALDDNDDVQNVWHNLGNVD